MAGLMLLGRKSILMLLRKSLMKVVNKGKKGVADGRTYILRYKSRYKAS
jgi:hypothetical protein